MEVGTPHAVVAYACVLLCAALPAWSAGVSHIAEPLFEGASRLVAKHGTREWALA